MAIEQNNQTGWLDRLGSFLGMGGDSGYRGDSTTGMTVPTSFNTSSNWQPPNVGVGAGTGSGLGFNLGTGQLALGGLSALSGIWSALQSNKLAQEQFDFQKDFANTNLNNQIKTYNTSLEDRLNARGAVEGRSADYTAAEIARRSLTR